MTVGVVYRVPGVGAVLVSDGRVTHEAEIVTETARKYIRCGATSVIVSGDIGVSWRQLQEKPPRSFAALRNVIAAAEDETDWLAYDRGADRVWLGEVNITRAFAAIGSGASLALGALEALPLARTLAAAENVALRAVQVACRRNTLCGGRIRTLVIPRRGAVVVR